jgi:hypothetical protein
MASILPSLSLHAVGFLCDRAFEKVDNDKNGFLEPLEVEVAVLYLYNAVRPVHGSRVA